MGRIRHFPERTGIVRNRNHNAPVKRVDVIIMLTICERFTKTQNIEARGYLISSKGRSVVDATIKTRSRKSN
jgi:hypothetical protein